MAKLNQNEELITKAIKDGSNTVETISEHSGISKNVVHLLCGSLCKKLIIRKSPNDKTFSIVDPKENREITVCYGNLLLPVKFYTSKTGQRYAIRGGTWNPIGEKVSENDIEWIDDSDSIESKKSKGVPKDRTELAKPTIKIIAVPEFEQWLQSPLADKQITGSHIMENGIYRIKLEILETRGDKTNVKAMIKINIGKVQLANFPSIKPEYLIDTKTLSDFILGKGKFPFTIEDFVWRDMKKVVYFPIFTKVFPDSSCVADVITFTKTKPKNAMQWNIHKFTCGAQSKEGRYGKPTGDGTGTLQEAVEKHKITSFINGLEGFKIKK